MVKEFSATPENKLDPEFVKFCRGIKAKRARTVINHILKEGFITTEDLSERYGYHHPPRAICDVRENGIPLITHNIISDKTSRPIAAYTFGDLTQVRRGRIGGRRAFSKQFKRDLLSKYGARDGFSREYLDERYLQVDHRVPYQVAGDADTLDPGDYMLIDASSQRAKSWSCEHCENSLSKHNVNICKQCFWAYPENYTHVAMSAHRRIDLVWRGDDVEFFDKIKAIGAAQGMDDMRDFIKGILCEYLERKGV